LAWAAKTICAWVGDHVARLKNRSLLDKSRTFVPSALIRKRFLAQQTLVPGWGSCLRSLTKRIRLPFGEKLGKVSSPGL
jgi:hypothetical protein